MKWYDSIILVIDAYSTQLGVVLVNMLLIYDNKGHIIFIKLSTFHFIKKQKSLYSSAHFLKCDA